ncbi:ABC transporter permease [Parafilimonas sp.]|uniref:ABC transporter permease n=1 Tax=Parafilimonas sp. TaxID=1969739 RepID=UPI0039E2ED43
MFKNYFPARHFVKTAWRSLWKNKLFAVVNIIGLSVGFASIIALLAGVYMYYTADDMQQHKEDLYYLKSVDPKDASSSSMLTTFPLLDEIVRTCPEVKAATHIQQWYYPWLKHGDNEVQETTYFVDADFFRVFTLPLKYGNPDIVFKNKYDVVLSDKIATKLFGNINPVGKIITADDSLQLTVAGVLNAIPSNSSIKGDVFLTTSFLKYALPGFANDANWYNRFAINFLRLRDNANIPLLEKKIAHIVDLNYDKQAGPAKIIAVPFSGFKNENGALVQTIVKGSIATACFILLVIIFNLINLNAASMYTRAKEVAVRKVIGGGRLQIFAQFCIENGLIFIIALVGASLLFADVLMPQLNAIYKSRFTELSLSVKDIPVMLCFAVLSLVIVIAAGSLPALRLIGLPVATGVKGELSRNIKSGSYLRNIFIVLQFTLAVVFICVTIILNRQINYMQQASLGYDTENTVVVNLDMGFKNISRDSAYFATLINNLKNNPYVKSFSTSQAIPTDYESNYDTYIDPSTGKEVTMRYSNVDAGYVNTYSIPVIKGRDFNDDMAATEKNAVMINKKAMNALGWKNITGRQLVSKGGGDPVKVVGVMDDFNYQDMQKGIEPLMHSYYRPGLDLSNLSLKIDPKHTNEVMQQLQAAFKQMSGRRPFKYTYMRDLVDKQYDLLNGILRITNFVAFLTITISCMGMFALISLYAKQRVKEIGIRKVLGAKVSSVVMLLSKDFVLFVLIACVIATPVALWVMHSWLQGFTYRVQMEWWMFAAAAIIAIAIAVITVSFQSVKAAMANPVKSLRTE